MSNTKDFKINTIVSIGSPKVGEILTKKESLTLGNIMSKLSKDETIILSSIFYKLHKHNVKLDIIYHDLA